MFMFVLVVGTHGLDTFPLIFCVIRIYRDGAPCVGARKNVENHLPWNSIELARHA